jgi:hypothetical protein
VPEGEGVAIRRERGGGPRGGEDRSGVAHTARGDEVVQFPEDKGVNLANLHTCGSIAAAYPFNAPVALDGHGHLRRWTLGQRVEGHHVEGADHGTHGAPDAFLLIDQDEGMLLISRDGSRGAHL